MQNIKNISTKIFSFIIMTILCIISSPLIANAFSGVNYYWSVKIMFESGSLQGDVITDEEGTAWDESYYQRWQSKATSAQEAKLSSWDKLIKDTTGITRNPLNISTASVIHQDSAAATGKNPSFSASSYKPFSFPGIANMDSEGDRGNDLAQANKINSKLVNDFNTALSYFQSSDGESLTSKDLSGADGKVAMLKAVAALSIHPDVKSEMNDKLLTIQMDNIKYSLKISGISDTEAQTIIDNKASYLKKIGIGTNVSDVKKYFIKVAPGSNQTKYTILQWMYPKGYGKGEPLYAEYQSEGISEKENEYVPNLSWFHVGINALSNYSYGIYSSNSKDLYESQGTLLGGILNVFSSLFNAFLGLFGAETIDELIFNTGGRLDYYYGIAPESWFNNLSFILICAYVVSLTILGVAFVKNFMMGNIAILNPAAKANVMNGLMNILYAILVLTFYIPVIGLLFSLNKTIVEFCYETSHHVSFINSLTSTGFDFAGLIAGFILLFFTVKINIMYIIRSLYIVVLYALGPLFVTSIGFSGKNQDLFKNWLKELLGQLFLQSFHALILLIYIKMGVSSGNILLKCVLAYSFIPLGKLFRDKLMSFGGGNVDNPLRNGKGLRTAMGGAVATMAGGALANTMMGNAAGKLGGQIKGKPVPGTGNLPTYTGSDGSASGDSMKDNDVLKGESYSTSNKGKVGTGVSNIAKGIGLAVAGAGVAALGGNNKAIAQVSGDLLGSGFSSLNSWRKGKSSIKEQQKYNENMGIADSTITTDEKGNPTYNGMYSPNSDIIKNQKYEGSDGQMYDMNTEATTFDDGTQGFIADMDAISAKDKYGNPLHKDNPLYDLANKLSVDATKLDGVENAEQAYTPSHINAMFDGKPDLKSKYDNFEFVKLDSKQTSNHKVGIRIKENARVDDLKAHKGGVITTRTSDFSKDITKGDQIVDKFVNKKK